MRPFNVPPDIAGMLDEHERTREARELSARQALEDAERAKRDRWDRIEALRTERSLDLHEAGRTLRDWIAQFETTVGSSVWQMLGKRSSVTLFVGRFWQDEPLPPNVVTESACLRLNSPDQHERLVYEERHKGMLAAHRAIFVPASIGLQVHPEFALQCAAHLEGPDAWKYVRTDLERAARLR